MRTIFLIACVLLSSSLTHAQVVLDPPPDAIVASLQARLMAEQQRVQELEAELETLRQQLRSTKQPEPTRAPVIKFTMITASDCGACPGIKKNVEPWAKSAGYQWDHIEHIRMYPGHTYPYYRLCVGDYCEEFESPVRLLGEAIAQRLRKWGFSNFTMRDVAQRPAKPTEYRTQRKTWGQYEGHFTKSVRNQTIEFHLTQPEPIGHGVDITGMSVAEMEATHQRLHGWNY